jgi:hypothetical protein
MAMLVASGCASKQNVGPLYEGAMKHFESARVLEQKAVSASRDATISEFEKLFEAAREGSKDDLVTLIVAQWDLTEGDFRKASREKCHQAILGESPSEATRLTALGTLDRYLKCEFPYVNSASEEKSIQAYELLTIPGNVAGLRGPLEPHNTQIQVLQQKYDAWYQGLRTEILTKMPAMDQIESAREQVLARVKAEAARRSERIDMVYGALLEITEDAKVYAGSLTDNVALVSLANRALSAANSMMGKWKSEKSKE